MRLAAGFGAALEREGLAGGLRFAFLAGGFGASPAGESERFSASMKSITFAPGRRLALDRHGAAAGHLALDEIAQSLGVMVVETGGVESLAAAVDELLGHFQHVRSRLLMAERGEHVVGVADFAVVAQGVEHQAGAAGVERDQVFPAPQGELADADLARLAQGVVDDGVTFLRHLAVGQDVIGALEIDGVDVGGVDELRQFDAVARLQPHRVEFVLFQQHVIAGLDLVAHDDVFAGDLPVADADLDVADALLGFAVDLVKARRRLGALGRNQPHRNGDQRQPQIAFPEGADAFGHGNSLRNRPDHQRNSESAEFPTENAARANRG